MIIPFKSPIETERKFLVAGPGWQDHRTTPAIYIEQLYLYHSGGTQVRLRHSHTLGVSTWYMTTKIPMSGVSRYEFEVEISCDEYEKFRPNVIASLRKIRWVIPYGSDDMKWEVDVYEDDRTPSTVEIEFRDPVSPVDIMLPDWVGQEVTMDPYYSNFAIARRGMA